MILSFRFSSASSWKCLELPAIWRPSRVSRVKGVRGGGKRRREILGTGRGLVSRNSERAPTFSLGALIVMGGDYANEGH